MTKDYTLSGPYPFTCPAWVALPGFYAPASIALQVTGALKIFRHDKAAVLKEEAGKRLFLILEKDSAAENEPTRIKYGSSTDVFICFLHIKFSTEHTFNGDADPCISNRQIF
jgi:hypothetical protein